MSSAREQTRTDRLGAEHAPDAALCVHDLTVGYQGRPVLWDIDLDVPRGSIVGLVGPNGAGKSTLLRAVMEMIPRLSGEVRILGQPLAKVRQRVAFVPQRESVDWEFPVRVIDVVTMGLFGRIGWFRPVRRRHHAQAMVALERVGMAELAERQISQLSGGQQQRTFLARALVQDPEVALLDEPFAAVDAATEEAIVAILRELRSRGRTMLVVHHDLPTAPLYFDRIILLNQRVVAEGPTAEVFTAENLHRAYGGSLTILSEAATALGAARSRS
ncbi:MAG: metal ABC transporter ATP-binding protein [Phycisphaeraceae bacterium]|nr:metal ABC transporter ATP-binding protein [Phycisphaeraceae bacterium]